MLIEDTPCTENIIVKNNSHTPIATENKFATTLSYSSLSERPKSVSAPSVSSSIPIRSTPILIRKDSFGYGRGSFSPLEFSPVKSPILFSPNESHFAGSFQESLISGRMANIPSTFVDGFYAVITYSYSGLTPAPKLQIPFDTYCYHLPGAPSPYVGTIDLTDEKFKIPSDGLLQVTIFNPTQTPIKTFIVKYDLTDMPPKTKTFLRQTTTTKSPPSKLEYAIHFHIVSPKKKRFYLHKNIRIVFPYRKPDEKMEPLQTETLFPNNPKFYPMR